MNARADIVAEARLWLATPFHHGQMLRGVGCDCIGLIAGVGHALGMPEAAAWREDPRYRGYGRLPLPGLLIEACDEYLDRIQVAALQSGDVALMTYASDPMHFGIITESDPAYIIHATERRGKVVEHRVDAHWHSMIVRAYRFRGVV